MGLTYNQTNRQIGHHCSPIWFLPVARVKKTNTHTSDSIETLQIPIRYSSFKTMSNASARGKVTNYI